MHPVMVIDDDEDIRDGMAWLLEARGFTVLTAAHGREALDRLREGPRPCLIVLDLMMPVMNGWDFRERVLADPALCDIPVVVVTGDATAVGQRERLKARAVLVKPCDLDQLVRVVQSYC